MSAKQPHPFPLYHGKLLQTTLAVSKWTFFLLLASHETPGFYKHSLKKKPDRDGWVTCSPAIYLIHIKYRSLS